MYKYSTLFILGLIILSCSESDKFNASTEIPDLEIFEERSDIPFDDSNFNEAEVALGRILFHDKRLSLNNSIACSHCHKQELAFADNTAKSRGLNSELTLRNSMSLTNMNYNSFFFWEGSSSKLDRVVLNPISNHLEMGMRSIDDLIEKLESETKYVELFDEVFNPTEGISERTISTAISEFILSLVSYNSKFDEGRKNNFVNFSFSEKNGMELFAGKALCGNCHQGDHFEAVWRKTANIGLDKEYQDQGAGSGRFKVPGLRNVELTAPYMHDGRFETLEEVIDHYTDGIVDHPALDWTLQSNKIQLTDLEKSDLVAFLKTLTDFKFISEPRYSDPFR